MESGVEIIGTSNAEPHLAGAVVHRRRRQQRITLAWSTSLLSKIASVGVQLLAVPLVYHVLGEHGYAAYAAVTASAGLIGALNLGIGGSLVTPIAEAAARSDEHRQAVLVQAGLGPLVLLCILGSMIVIPAVMFLPLHALFGKVGIEASIDLRVAAVIAVSATLATVPISAVTFLRQAYQEMHLSNLIGLVSNLLLCVGLIVAAKRSATVAVFVAIFVLIPLGANFVNLGWLISQRPFLMRSKGLRTWKHSRDLLADGIRFIGADFSSVLLYQWPVYWIARSMTSSTSSWFAICMQAVVLPLASVFGLLLPLWPSTADAVARKDQHWLDGTIKKGRRAVLVIGGFALFTSLLFGERLLRIWLHKPVTLGWQLRGLMGAYVLLAIWEFYHFVLALGFGHLREAASAVFQRAIAFAIAVPMLTLIGGVELLWCGMCCSVLFWSAWRLPRLLHIQALSESKVAPFNNP